MKLIIDIQDFVYNHIKEFNSTQLYELNVITAIKNSMLLEEELEYLKADIRFRGYYDERIEDLINEHIAELKGENNGETTE